MKPGIQKIKSRLTDFLTPSSNTDNDGIPTSTLLCRSNMSSRHFLFYLGFPYGLSQSSVLLKNKIKDFEVLT